MLARIENPTHPQARDRRLEAWLDRSNTSAGSSITPETFSVGILLYWGHAQNHRATCRLTCHGLWVASYTRRVAVAEESQISRRTVRR